jgi:perosamine synthetase
MEFLKPTSGISLDFILGMNNLALEIAKAYRKIYETEDYIPLHAPKFIGNEKKYVLECLDSTFVSSVGKHVDRFQEKLSNYCGANYAVATVNGTAALHLALLIHKIGHGDEVICPDISFAATAASIVYTGADPVFLDVDEDTLGLSVEKVEAFLLNNTKEINGKRVNRITGKIIKACMPMHNVGFPVRINDLIEICNKFNLILIEDAAEALGSRIDEKMMGTFGSVGVYSFNGNKIITTGGGGALVTDSEVLFKEALHLSTTAKVPHPFSYLHDQVGYNYRMPNINAALGIAQIEKIEDFIQMKKRQLKELELLLQSDEISIVKPKFGASNNWFTVAKINHFEIKVDALIHALNDKGIMARPLWSQLSKMKPYSSFMAEENPVSCNLLTRYICLPNGVK